MKIRITVQFEVAEGDNSESPISDPVKLGTLADETANDIHTRLFGAGFLPPELTVFAYDIFPEVVD